MQSRWRAVSALLATLGLATVLAARQEPAPTFRSGIDLIQLDVSVLDRDRRPVTDLKAADFTVRVDGVVRPVVGFKAVTLPPPPPPPSAPWMRDVAPDVATNTRPGGRAIVIMIDDATVASMDSDAGPSFWTQKARATARRNAASSCGDVSLTIEPPRAGARRSNAAPTARYRASRGRPGGR